ncbi:hypothetical protein HDV00_009607 [Rhizophlyctis rosea]|nr:hypothetical protein HDV00_009607 [Rhizophlyctis rosea]
MILSMLFDWTVSVLKYEVDVADMTGNSLMLGPLLSCLGTVYQDQGMYGEAERHLRGSLDTWRELLGDSHPQTFEPLLNLSSAYFKQSKCELAEQSYEEYMAKVTEFYGEDDGRILLAMGNLSHVYLRRGKLSEAENMILKLLPKLQEDIGGNRESRILVRVTLAKVRMEQGRYGEAEDILKDCWERGKVMWGKAHPNTLKTAGTLAKALQARGSYAEAEELCKYVIEEMGRMFGEDHANTLVEKGGLAELYVEQERFTNGEALYRDCLEGYGRTDLRDHQEAFVAANNLMTVEKSRRIFGNNEFTLKLMGKLAELYDDMEKYKEAEKWYDECEEVTTELHGEDHPTTKVYMERANRVRQILIAQFIEWLDSRPQLDPRLLDFRNMLVHSLRAQLAPRSVQEEDESPEEEAETVNPR